MVIHYSAECCFKYGVELDSVLVKNKNKKTVLYYV